MSNAESESECIGKEPCPECGSRDNLGRYTDGHGFCFGCNYYEHATEGTARPPTSTKGKPMTDFIRGEFVALKKRGLTEESCRKYGYLVGKDKHGKTVQVATYRRDGNIVGQKTRSPDKEFFFLGDIKQSGL